MRPAVLLLVLVLGSRRLWAQSAELAIPRATQRPSIDGVLDDTAWRGAALLEHWVQTRPGDNVTPAGPTVAYLTYDANALYLAVRAGDAAGKTRGRLHERDGVAMQGQDFITVLIDTFNDRRRAFSIYLNPLGIQGDGIQIEGGGFSEWDGLFDSRGRMSPEGYVIELAIPFKSLRFPAGAEQRWGFAIVRHYGRDGMEDTPWKRNRDLSCDLCQMITLTGIRGIGANRNLELNPALVSRISSQRPELASPFAPSTTGTQLGLNGKIGLTSGLTLDATWNPDFSQIEADAGQLELNNRLALFFPEKRPFFLESTDILESRVSLPGQFADFNPAPMNLVYTRRVVEPDAGAKLTGKLGRLRVGAIAALDAAHDYEFASAIGGLSPAQLDPFDGDRARVGVARGKLDVLADGFIGGTLTARRFADGHQFTGAVDTRLRFGAGTTVHLLAAHSESRDPTLYRRVSGRLASTLGSGSALDAALDSLPAEARDQDGAARRGNGIQAQIEYASRHWNLGAGYADLTDHFETALGFTPRTDLALFGAKLEFLGRSGGFLQEIRPAVRVQNGYAHQRDRLFSLGEHTDFILSPSLDLRIAGPTDLSVGYTRAFLRFDGLDFPGLDRWYFAGNSQALGQLGLDIFIRGGEEIIFEDEVDAGPPLPDSFLQGSLNTALRPLSPLRMELGVAGARIWRRTATVQRESKYAESVIPRLKTTLQLSQRLGLRAIGEFRYERFYHTTGALAKQRQTLSADVLATYLIHPGQSLQLGWSQLSEGDLDNPLRSTRRGGIAKLSYLWRL